MKNTPYVKKYKDGFFINPIVGSYTNKFPNRRTRRATGGRAFNNKAGTQLVVTRIGLAKFDKRYKRLQVVDKRFIRDKKGRVIGIEPLTETKQLTHYDA